MYRKTIFKTLSLFFILAYASSTAYGQFAGWPSSSSGAEIDVISKTVTSQEYLDDNRAQVTGYTLVSSSPLRYDLNVSAPAFSSLFSLSFPANKWCVLIQMEDNINGTVGTNSRVTVVSFSPGTGVLQVEVPSGSLPTFDFSSSSRVQIVRVPVYWDMYLNPGGELTCHAYNHDDGTGGVAAVVVGNTTYFNGGIINASGKGYHYSWSTGVPDLGQGGTGVAGSTNITAGNIGGTSGGPAPAPVGEIYVGGLNPPGTTSGYAPPEYNTGYGSFVFDKNNKRGYLCHSTGTLILSSSGVDYNGANPGDDGEAQQPPTAVNDGTMTNFGDVLHFYPSTPANSSSWAVLRMGNSGGPGTQGGTGGGGGGAGGKGGTNNSPLNNNQFGQTGLNGQLGGNAGEGARGGGVILLKINSYSRAANILSAKKLLFVDGQNGQHGTNGGNGGTGGAGGLGEDGTCNGSTLIPPGGVGGFGESGIGAQGGDGGSGGECGTIWIMKKSTGFSFSSHVSLRGGKGGGGGGGGYSERYRNLPLATNYSPGSIATLPCNTFGWYTCPPPTPPLPDLEICDCDKVFEHIANDLQTFTISNNNSGVLPSGSGGTPWSITGNGYTVYFDDNHEGQHVLYYIEPGTPRNKRYNCMMYRQNQYLEMMKKLFQVNDLIAFVPGAGSVYKVGSNLAVYNSLNIELKYLDPSNGAIWHNLTYYPKSAYGFAQLKDIDDPKKPIVYAGNCSYDEGYPGCCGSSSGSGGLEPPAVITFWEQSGPSGNDGNDAPDGNIPDNFDEGDNAPLIKPIDEGSNWQQNFIETTELVTVANTESGQTKSVHLLKLENGKADYRLYSLTGQLIRKGSFTDELKLTGIAPGYYIIEIVVGTSTDRRKLQLGE